ncbi:hypothetical protein ACOSQ3_001605 [Xanthoceras sorbifolium]
MEKKHSSCPLDACEKMFKAIAASSPFRRRISHYPQDPISLSANHASNSSPPQPPPAASFPIAMTHDSPQRLKPLKNREAAEVVPVTFKHAGLPTYAPARKNGKVANNIAPLVKTKPTKAQPGNTMVSAGHGQVVIIEPEPPVLPQKSKPKADKIPQVHRMESNKPGPNAEERFTNYINRAKFKIRNTSSNLGDGFQSRTTSSSVGDGKMVSGEDNNNKDHFSDYINRAKLKMMRTVSSFGGGRSDSMK